MSFVKVYTLLHVRPWVDGSKWGECSRQSESIFEDAEVEKKIFFYYVQWDVKH